MLHATSNRKSPQGIVVKRSKYAMRNWFTDREGMGTQRLASSVHSE